MPPCSKGKTLYNPINKLNSKLFCGHALIYFFSFFDFQKTFLVYFRRNEPDIRPGSDADIFMSMKRSASESIRNAYFNLEPFFPPSPTGNFVFGTTLERLWFRHRTFHAPNLMHKLLCYLSICKQFNSESSFLFLNLVRLELRSASESFGSANIRIRFVLHR